MANSGKLQTRGDWCRGACVCTILCFIQTCATRPLGKQQSHHRL